MQKFYDTIVDQQGNALSNIPVAIYEGANPSTLALIYADDETTTKTNPLGSDENGFVSAKLANGTYNIVVGSGDTAVTIAGYVAFDPADGSSVKITGGTIDGVTIGGTTPPNGTFNDVTVNGTFDN